MHRAVRVAVVGSLGLALAGAVVALAVWRSTPPAHQLARRVELRLRGTGGRPVPLTAVAPVFLEALVATEDERFYRHHGIDLIGLARAVPYDLAHLSFAQGASTLTEQVAKLLYLNGNDHTPWRKAKDMALAVKLEDRYSKAQILDAYVNTAYFGGGAYGIAAAAKRYFDTLPRRLTVAEASLLAGLPQAPTAYDPLVHPRAARARQVAVLRSLVRIGDASAAEALQVLKRPLVLRGGHSLAAAGRVDVTPGPPLAWGSFAAGVALAAAGAAFAATRLVRGLRLLSLPSGILASLLVLLGIAVMLRSFRTM